MTEVFATMSGLAAAQITILGLTYGSWGSERYGTKPAQARPRFPRFLAVIRMPKRERRQAIFLSVPLREGVAGVRQRPGSGRGRA